MAESSGVSMTAARLRELTVAWSVAGVREPGMPPAYQVGDDTLFVVNVEEKTGAGIQAAIDQIVRAKVPGVVLLAPGDYVVTSPLVFPERSRGVRLAGVDRDRVTLSVSLLSKWVGWNKVTAVTLQRGCTRCKYI